MRRSKLTALVRSGDLQPAMRSVYVLAKRKPMPRVDERTYAAWLALDGQRLPWERDEPVVVLSHAPAARLHGLGTLPNDVVEMTSATRRTTTLPAIRIHIAPLDASDWQWAMERRDHGHPRRRGRSPTSRSHQSSAATCSTRSTTQSSGGRPHEKRCSPRPPDDRPGGSPTSRDFSLARDASRSGPTRAERALLQNRTTRKTSVPAVTGRSATSGSSDFT